MVLDLFYWKLNSKMRYGWRFISSEKDLFRRKDQKKLWQAISFIESAEKMDSFEIILLKKQKYYNWGFIP